MSRELAVVRAADVRAPAPEEAPWLVESLWGAGAVGVIGGAPKSGKTWLALDLAVAVASGRSCLGRFAVPRAGPTLVYAAEDSPPQVRERVEHLARARGAEFETLPLSLIVEPSLRLDLEEDVVRLRATLARYRPSLLVLDPYVRLQRADENNATEVSAILATLRHLSRANGCAIALVHHARKNGGSELGEGLRGSSDFHAWGDSNLYVRRRREGIVLSIEHRAAASPPPVTLALVGDDGPVRLEVRATASSAEPALSDRIVEELTAGPLFQEALRDRLRVRKQDLVDALRDLETAGRIVRTGRGLSLADDGAG